MVERKFTNRNVGGSSFIGRVKIRNLKFSKKRMDLEKSGSLQLNTEPAHSETGAITSAVDSYVKKFFIVKVKTKTFCLYI